MRLFTVGTLRDFDKRERAGKGLDLTVSENQQKEPKNIVKRVENHWEREAGKF